MTKDERTAMRRRILTARDRLSPEDLAQGSQTVAARVLALPAMNKAGVVLCYMHFRSEVRTGELLREYLARGVTVCVPLTLPGSARLLAVRIIDPEHEVAPGYCGIPEPLPELQPERVVLPGTIDAVIVPGSVFDSCGGRLGYGGGYYDRFLALAAPGAVRVALAFSGQLVERVPLEPHDQLMDFVVTEEQVYDCRRLRHAQDRRLSR